jgi:two-component system, NtrC family, sensor kinase
MTVNPLASSNSDRSTLENRESMFRALVEDANDMIATWGLDGIITYLSPGFQNMLGHDPAQWIGQPFTPLVHPEDLARCLATNQRVAATGEKSSGLEFRHQHQQGHWIWLSASIAPIKDENGLVVGFQGIMRDISDRRAFEDALRFIVASTAATSGDEFLRTCVRSLVEIFHVEYAFITELVEGVPNRSRMLALWTGESFAQPYEFDLKGTPCEMVFRDHWGIFPDAITTRFPTASGLATLNAESYLGIVITDSRGKTIGNLGIIDTKPLGHNVEQIKSILQIFALRVGAEMERQTADKVLRQYADQLENMLQALQSTQSQMLQSEKMSSLGQLVAGIAHEINNPVNFIHGNVTHTADYVGDLLDLITLYDREYPQPTAPIADKIDAIDLDFLRTDLPKSLASMKVGTERIREIVKSLRLFSRLDESEFKAVDIHDGIDSTLMILQNRIKGSSEQDAIEIVKNYAVLPEVECFPGQLNQVFMNVLVNAIDALEEGDRDLSSGAKTLRITTEIVAHEQVAIRIADNGSGMPAAIQAQIFNPFFTTKAVGKGTGMGMSISYQIVTEKHGGQIFCHSTPGQGTEFVIQIPIRQWGQGG